MLNPDPLHRSAREIFDAALASVDPRRAVARAIVSDGPIVEVCGERFDASSTPIYAVAVGKAAVSMALGLQDALGEKLAGGVVSHPALGDLLQLEGWQKCQGGHPLPNGASFAAAQVTFHLLDRANEERAIVVFLVSGGGSAMIEWPIGDAVSIEDLQAANQQLVSCGARINEINAVRRAFSAVKGGRLAQRAPDARIVTLIVSDTNRGDEANVASGPTLSPTDNIDPLDVIERYRLNLPKSVLESLSLESLPPSNPPYQVLLGNWTAVEAAHKKAVELGFTSSISDEICEQPIQDGCNLLLAASKYTDCLISGGEFSCPVRGDGVGGRNLETVLRCAIALENQQGVILSAGTDGIDGNSPAAGAIADQTTVQRARSLGLEAAEFLARSDSYTFFERLNDVIVTGPTRTNVRDLRIFITSS